MINFGYFFGLISLLCDWCELQLLSDLITVGLLDQPEQTVSVSFICAILFSFCILMDRTFNYFSCQMKLKLFRLTCFCFFFYFVFLTFAVLSGGNQRTISHKFTWKSEGNSMRWKFRLHMDTAAVATCGPAAVLQVNVGTKS